MTKIHEIGTLKIFDNGDGVFRKKDDAIVKTDKVSDDSVDRILAKMGISDMEGVKIGGIDAYMSKRSEVVKKLDVLATANPLHYRLALLRELKEFVELGKLAKEAGISTADKSAFVYSLVPEAHTPTSGYEASPIILGVKFIL
jgi:hypothetical protein